MGEVEETVTPSWTPVGDWVRRRYPPADGATHWMGDGADPGCRGGAHPLCLYAAAFAEGVRVEQERVAVLADARNAIVVEGREDPGGESVGHHTCCAVMPVSRPGVPLPVRVVCGMPATGLFRYRCVHGHVIDQCMCRDHTPEPGDVGCLDCYEAGHYCEMTFTEITAEVPRG